MYTPRYRRWKKGGKEVSILQFFSTAITSISKSTFKGKEATPTQDRSCRLMGVEVLGVYRVEFGKVFHVSQEYVDFDYIV